MSSNAPHSSMRRYVIAAAAALGCLLPAACDVAAASPGSHHNNTGGSSHHSGGGKTTTANSGGSASGGSASASATSDPGAGDQAAGDQGADNQGTGNQGANDQGNGGDAGATATNANNADSTAATTDPAAATTTAAATDGIKNNNGLDVLARDCSKSKLTPHTGFQIAPACVSTAFGEVADQDKDPSLLITDSPRFVKANTPFTIKVSTRNLVRDRFLGAAAGGYYLESSVLTADGIQRGHFHTACRMLSSTREAPEPGAVPPFFLATQDNGGGATPDTVAVTVDKGLPTRGIAQCAVWAGDGSHRIPMMERANQTPAFDAVRIFVG